MEKEIRALPDEGALPRVCTMLSWSMAVLYSGASPAGRAVTDKALGTAEAKHEGVRVYCIIRESKAFDRAGE